MKRRQIYDFFEHAPTKNNPNSEPRWSKCYIINSDMDVQANEGLGGCAYDKKVMIMTFWGILSGIPRGHAHGEKRQKCDFWDHALGLDDRPGEFGLKIWLRHDSRTSKIGSRLHKEVSACSKKTRLRLSKMCIQLRRLSSSSTWLQKTKLWFFKTMHTRHDSSRINPRWKKWLSLGLWSIQINSKLRMTKKDKNMTFGEVCSRWETFPRVQSENLATSWPQKHQDKVRITQGDQRMSKKDKKDDFIKHALKLGHPVQAHHFKRQVFDFFGDAPWFQSWRILVHPSDAYRLTVSLALS